MAEFPLNTKVGSAFMAGADYRPVSVRVHAESAPVGSQVIVNILDDGVSIFPDTTVSPARLALNSTLGKYTNFGNASTIRTDSVITLQFIALGYAPYASGVTVELELEER